MLDRSSTRRTGKRWKALVSIVGTLVLLASTTADAGNGDIVSISTLLADTGQSYVDLTSDSTDGSFWLLGSNGLSEESHRLVHVSQDGLELLGSVPNPHPLGTFPAITLNRGLSEGLGGFLYVLSSIGGRDEQEYVVDAVDREGAPIDGARFAISLIDDDANLQGLAWDPLGRRFWTRDVVNNKVLAIAPGGVIETSFRLVGVETAEDVIHGRGIAFDTQDFMLYVTYGDIRSSGPTRILQLTTEGELVGEELIADRTGLDVPLGQVETSAIGGIESFSTGALRLFAVIADEATLYQLEQVIPTIVPPSEVDCRLTLSNQVDITWQNNGSGEDDAYGGDIQILRNGVPFAVVAGGATRYLDQTPNDGTTTYTLRASEVIGAMRSPESSPCAASVGPGGIIDWSALPGRHCFDVTTLPDGDLLVTDDVTPAIVRLGPDLTPSDAGDIVSPWAHPGGIAYVPRILVGIPIPPGNLVELTDYVAISNSVDNRIRLASLADPSVGTTISLRFPPEVESPVVLGMTFIPGKRQADQRLIVVEGTSRRIHAFDPNGALVTTCLPPEIFIPVPLGGGIDYDPLQETFSRRSGMARSVSSSPVATARRPPSASSSVSKAWGRGTTIRDTSAASRSRATPSSCATEPMAFCIAR